MGSGKLQCVWADKAIQKYIMPRSQSPGSRQKASARWANRIKQSAETDCLYRLRRLGTDGRSMGALRGEEWHTLTGQSVAAGNQSCVQWSYSRKGQSCMYAPGRLVPVKLSFLVDIGCTSQSVVDVYFRSSPSSNEGEVETLGHYRHSGGQRWAFRVWEGRPGRLHSKLTFLNGASSYQDLGRGNLRNSLSGRTEMPS